MKHPTTTADPATAPCVYCGRTDCGERWEHRRLYGMSETTWRETARDLPQVVRS